MDISRLVAQKFPDKADRQIAQAVLSACSQGMREDQVAAFVHELAAPMDLSPEAHVNYVTGFLGAIGAPDVAQRFANWVDGGFVGSELAESAPAEPQVDPDDADDDGVVITTIDMTTLGRPAPPPPAPAGPTRADLEQRAAGHRSDLSAPAGSEGWNRYYRGDGQRQYLETLRMLETMPNGEGNVA